MSTSLKSLTRKIRREISRVSSLENYTLPESIILHEDNFNEMNIEENKFYVILSTNEDYKDLIYK